ncbi:MAG: hypothetical protein IPH03_10290 [Tetrasphaera sp.]|jgi:hypothetical protein|nr:hypothetical protein [Tetrasphaera sp.]
MSIGILRGPTPWDLAGVGADRPIITAADVPDATAAFVADPFGVSVDDRWFLFFEFMNRASGKGEIGVAESADLRDWNVRGTALCESFHLSYPAVYVIGGEFWMIPETWEAKQVRLYRAVDFPMRWTLEQVLIDGVPGTDPTLFRTSTGGWSMLLCGADGAHNSTLWRYDAPDIRGPWTRVEDPLISDRPDQARPGGHCFVEDGVTYRLGQDCSRHYGESLSSYPLTVPWTEGGRVVVSAAGRGWRARGGHHADLHRMPEGDVLAFVDGER